MRSDTLVSVSCVSIFGSSAVPNSFLSSFFFVVSRLPQLAACSLDGLFDAKGGAVTLVLLRRRYISKDKKYPFIDKNKKRSASSLLVPFVELTIKSGGDGGVELYFVLYGVWAWGGDNVVMLGVKRWL